MMWNSPGTVLFGLVCRRVWGGDTPGEQGLELLGSLYGSRGSHDVTSK